MPFVHRICLRSRAAAALALSFAVLAAPCHAHGDALPEAIGDATFAVASARGVPLAVHAPSASGMAVDPRFVIAWYVARATQAQAQEHRASATIMDGAIADASIVDDRALAHQRGTGPGLLTVAASPDMLHGARSVTLWDEIAPPSPTPVPADAVQAAQGNAVSYFRK